MRAGSLAVNAFACRKVLRSVTYAATIRPRKRLRGALMTTLSLSVLYGVAFSTFISFAAQAACSLPGKWHAVAIAVGTEDQRGASTVVTGCRFTIANNGNIRGTCRAKVLDQGTFNYTLSGNLKADSNCELSGVWQVQDFPQAVVLAGFASEKHAAFAAARGGNSPFQVRNVTMIKD